MGKTESYTVKLVEDCREIIRPAGTALQEFNLTGIEMLELLVECSSV